MSYVLERTSKFHMTRIFCDYLGLLCSPWTGWCHVYSKNFWQYFYAC